MPELLRFKTPAEWRSWLEVHHASASEAWLLHYRKNSHKEGVRYREALDEAISFGWIDTKLKSLDGESFMLRYVPRKPGSLWSRLNRDRAEELLQQGRMAPAGVASIEEARKSGRWDAAYTLRVPLELPEDLKKALGDTRMALSNFEAFANSYRNTYIHWVNSARSDATRRRRISEVVRCSAENIKPGAPSPRRSGERPPR